MSFWKWAESNPVKMVFGMLLVSGTIKEVTDSITGRETRPLIVIESKPKKSPKKKTKKRVSQ